MPATATPPRTAPAGGRPCATWGRVEVPAEHVSLRLQPRLFVQAGPFLGRRLALPVEDARRVLSAALPNRLEVARLFHARGEAGIVQVKHQFEVTRL